ncbi:hypothetical protein [Rikenella microfusus]|uniref:Uncharacterized protein n=1 Tax=Rikenella microfusus TaxID=28139 RepID=A0A379MR87_9BACT|nr:hypothetical protein [Rikenella microfusus]SUE33132.1 Uncharacterised protein [Rikenella microfusus]HJE87966.1 hypothetical protein [Rikenella microfusus]
MRIVIPSDIERLRQAIENHVGRRLQSPTDFDWCSLRIAEQTGERISPTTLKRLWGYLNEGHAPRLSTLSSLARFLGTCDWEDWLRKEDSGFIVEQTFTAAELVAGDRLELTWRPDRWCVIEYRGCENFVVRDIRHAKLPVGARFRATLFTAGHPLYLSGTLPAGEPFTYIAGRSQGLSSVQIITV